MLHFFYPPVISIASQATDLNENWRLGGGKKTTAPQMPNKIKSESKGKSSDVKA